MLKLNPTFRCLLFPVAFTMAGTSTLSAQEKAQHAKCKPVLDLVYAEVADAKLMLDLYLPLNVEKPPLVVYIHGGGWRSGDRKDTFANWLTNHGYAVASIDYRLSNTATFPAQIHDCKGAVRWLRAHAAEYGYNTERIAAMGTSAGGYLAVLLGTTGDEKELEGEVGGNLDQSSRVQVVVDFYGPIDFVLRSKDQPDQTDKPGGKVYQLLGNPVLRNLELAKLASSVNHVTKDDPPLLIFHGTADKTVLMNQAERIRDAYKEAGLPVEFHVVEGAGHGGAQYSTWQCQEPILKFLAQYLTKAAGGNGK